MMDDSRPGARHEPTLTIREDAAAPSDDEDSDGEFEFPFVSRDAAAAGSGGAAPADELFAGGRIRAFYPVFGRVLLDDATAAASAALEPEPSRAPLGRLFQLEKARTSSVASTSSSSSSAAGSDLDAASPDSYCLWTPGSASSPARPAPRKSGSTGSSMARWRRIGELVVGRSHSDGREKFLFLSAPPSPARDRAAAPNNAKAAKPKARRTTKAAATEIAAGRRMSYGGGGGGAAAKGGSSPGARRTFLPYRQDLMGLFANVHGLSRSHQHPF